MNEDREACAEVPHGCLARIMGEMRGEVERLVRERDAALERLRLLDEGAAEQFSRALGERDARIAELEKLAYIGEHHFPDLTYKSRLEEALTDLREAERQRDEYARRAEVYQALVEREGAKAEDPLDEPVWYELTEVEEVKVRRKMPPGTTVRGPIDKVLVVMLDRGVLDGLSPETGEQVVKTTLDSAKAVLKASGWDGEVLMVTSDLRLMRLRRLEDRCAGCGWDRARAEVEDSPSNNLRPAAEVEAKEVEAK